MYLYNYDRCINLQFTTLYTISKVKGTVYGYVPIGWYYIRPYSFKYTIIKFLEAVISSK